MIFLRSTLFNILFYGATAVACIVCLPTLLMPRKTAFAVVRAFVTCIRWLEKRIIGLDYEVRGSENLPESGAFIIAAKHQSPYETFKLHLLFDDPAIVLKRELLKIPLWGLFLARIDPIAIDRGSPRQALAQMVEGARRVKAQGRPLVIFPQGTRVYAWQTAKDKPYKGGISNIYEDTRMPVIPLALNSGLFWPRRSWIKYPGLVTLRFLPPIPPGMDARTFMTVLEAQLEGASQELQNEALEKFRHLPLPTRPAGIEQSAPS